MEHYSLVFLGLCVIVLSMMVVSNNNYIKKLKKAHQEIAEIHNFSMGHQFSEIEKLLAEIAELQQALDSLKKAPPSVAKQYNQPKPRYRFSLKQKAVIIKQYQKCIDNDIPLENLVAGLNREFGCNKSYRAYENVWRNADKSE